VRCGPDAGLRGEVAGRWGCGFAVASAGSGSSSSDRCPSFGPVGRARSAVRVAVGDGRFLERFCGLRLFFAMPLTSSLGQKAAPASGAFPSYGRCPNGGAA